MLNWISNHVRERGIRLPICTCARGSASRLRSHSLRGPDPNWTHVTSLAGGDRLILGTPRGTHLEWQRAH
jgi:hypothetical protein